MIKNNKIYRNKSYGIRWQDDPIEREELSRQWDAIQRKGFIENIKHWWAYWTRKEGRG